MTAPEPVWDEAIRVGLNTHGAARILELCDENRAEAEACLKGVARAVADLWWGKVEQRGRDLADQMYPRVVSDQTDA